MAVLRAGARCRWLVLGLVTVAQTCTSMIAQAAPPLVPLFQPELGLTKAQAGLFSSAVFAGSWGVLVLGGSLTDRFGIRRVLPAGQILAGMCLVLMATVGGFAQALVVLLAAGLGRGAALPGQSKAILDWFPSASRATAMGVKQSGMPIAGIVTASTLPAIGLAFGWRYGFVAVGLVVMVGGLLTRTLYREAAQSTVSRSDSGLRRNLGRMLRNRRLWTVSAVAVLYSGAQNMLLGYLALYLKEVALVPIIAEDAARVVAAGSYLALCDVGGICGRVAWGLLSDRFLHGRRATGLVAIGLISGALVAVLGSLEPGQPPVVLAAVVFALGMTIVGWNGLYQTLTGESIGKSGMATGIAFSLTLAQAGLVLGPPLFGLVADVTGAYQPAWLLLAAICVSGGLASTALLKGDSAVG